MPELRKDPVIGRWVIIATERARRPGNFVDPERNVFKEPKDCPFCMNKDKAIYEVKAPKSKSDKSKANWQVKVVQRKSPYLKTNGKVKRKENGLYFVLNDYGVHEMVLETPEHIANMADLDVEQIKRVIDTYVVRFNALEEEGNLQYVLAFKNYGWASGSRSIGHARSQIIATTVNPLDVKEKLVGAKKYFDYHDRCLYCDLIKAEGATKSRIVCENKDFLAVMPFAPRFPFETWIMPKQHHCDFAKGVKGEEKGLAKILKEVLQRLKIGLDDPAYNYVIHTAPFHRETRWDRWRTIEEDYHWHIEVIPRLTRAAGFEKGSGFYICPIPPETTAEFLREVEI